MPENNSERNRVNFPNEPAEAPEELNENDLDQVAGGLALEAAAKQLDATTQSGGPTAAQNQKIQE